MNVTIKFKDGEQQTLATDRKPWEWSGFVCIRTPGRVATSYYPIEDISSFEVNEEAA